MFSAFLSRYLGSLPWLGFSLKTKEGYTMTTLATPERGFKNPFDERGDMMGQTLS